MELMMDLQRRGYLLTAAAGNCGRPSAQYDVALVDWRRRTLHALEATMDWLANFLSPSAVLVIWVDAQKPAATESLRALRRNAASLSCAGPCMTVVARLLWRDDRRPIRSKTRRSPPSGRPRQQHDTVFSTQGRISAGFFGKESRCPSRRCAAPSFASGWRSRARNDNPVSKRQLLPKPRSSGIICHAAAERRMK